MPEIISAPCPKCQVIHAQKEREGWSESERIIIAPPDVICECGLILRWCVPLFKVNKSGCELRAKTEEEVLRLHREWKEIHFMRNLKVGDQIVVDGRIAAKITFLDEGFYVFTDRGSFPWTVSHTFKKKST